MNDQNQAAPAEINVLVAEVKEEVIRTTGVEPDMTPETLPLVDAYLRDVVGELGSPEREARLQAVGAYFGEVVRRQLAARWFVEGDPFAWRVELTSCFLHFRPVSMAAETLVGCESEEYDGTFSTLEELRDDLERMLEQAPPLPEDEYFSLCGRLEVLSLVADWLVSLRLGEDKTPKEYSPADYRAVLDGV